MTMLPRFTLKQIYYFVTVADFGGITRAAEQINISSPSLSTAIAQLEATFGLQLFIRQHSQGLVLTGVGKRFLDEARRLLTQASDMRRSAQEIGGRLQGPVAVGFHAVLAALLAPVIWRSFKTSYRDVEWAPTIGGQALLIDKLISGEIDVALTSDFKLPAELTFESLAQLPAYAMLPADNFLAEHAAVSLAELSRLPLLLLNASDSRDYCLSLFEAAGLVPIIAAEVSDTNMLRSMVENGLGYAILSGRSALSNAAQSGQVSIRPVADEHEALRIGVATGYRDCAPRIVSAFSDHCRQAIDELFAMEPPPRPLQRAVLESPRFK